MGGEHSLNLRKKHVIDPIDVQFGLAHDCIRACVFADHINRTTHKSDAWWSIMDMCYSDAIVSWNAIFGSDSQSSHWKHLMEELRVPERAVLKPFCRAMIVNYLSTSEAAWRKYHKQMCDFRNNRLAHFRTDISGQEPPNVTWALHSAYLYREWLLSLLRAHQDAGRRIKITETSGPEMLALFRKQIEEVCK